jgi:hypothetical protein
MKKLFLSLFLVCFSIGIFAQTEGSKTGQGGVDPTLSPFTLVSYTNVGKVVEYSIPLTLTKAATSYSEVFSLDGFTPQDSVKWIPVLWAANDTCQITSITIQAKSTVTPNGVVPTSQWFTFATPLATPQANGGNDTVYTKNVVLRGTVSATDEVSASGAYGDKARIKVVFANPTTVGNGGYLRVWIYLRKQ